MFIESTFNNFSSGTGGGGTGGGGTGGGGTGGGSTIDDDNCGKRFFGDHFAANTNSNGYIVGGHNAERGSLPWQVSHGLIALTSSMGNRDH